MVQIENRHKRYKLNGKLLKKIIKEILGSIKRPNAELEFIFLDDRAIKDLNKKYKGRNLPTDVLSFEMGPLGLVAISLDRARANAKIFNTALTYEAVLYVIHGILHLFGYDDEDPGPRRRMAYKEMRILECLSTKIDLSKVLTPL